MGKNKIKMTATGALRTLVQHTGKCSDPECLVCEELKVAEKLLARTVKEAAERKRTVLLVLWEENAKRLIERLMAESQWFEVDPMPDGQWGIQVKEEIGKMSLEWAQWVTK